MTTYEKIVKGATKVKVAPPKPKYIEPILMATSIDHTVESENFNTIMRTLRGRLQDSAWSVVYKSLIVIHIMIREGDRDVTLKFLANQAPDMLNLSTSNIVRSHGSNSDVRSVSKYAKYLSTRVKQFGVTNTDYVRDERSNNSTMQTGGRLRSLSVDKGLLREIESVQKQIDALLRNNYMENEINNDIILTAFRLLVNDLLSLFQELNEGVINLLEHYFEMFRLDAERALKIYKKFVDQTKYVIDFLRVAKHLEHSTKLHVPTIKYAPTALTSSLEEYLDDPNFELNRQQYLADRNKTKSSKGIKGENSRQNIKEVSNKQPTQEPQNPGTSQATPMHVSGAQSGSYNHTSGPPPLTNNGIQSSNALLVQQSTFNPWANSLQYQAPSNIVPYTTGSFNENGRTANPLITGEQVFQPNSGAVMSDNTTSHYQVIPQPLNVNPTFTGSGFGNFVQQQATGSNPFLQNSSTGNPQVLISQGQNIFSRQPTQNFNSEQYAQYQQRELPQDLWQEMSPRPPNQPIQQQTLTGNRNRPFLGGTALNGSDNKVPSVSSSSNAMVNNPFATTRFAPNSETTAFTFNSGVDHNVSTVGSTETGTNPFRVSQNTQNLFNQVSHQNNPQRLHRQVTAGGLENIPTIPIFYETQRQNQNELFLNNARSGIQQQLTKVNTDQAHFHGAQETRQPQYVIDAQQLQNNAYDGPSLI